MNKRTGFSGAGAWAALAGALLLAGCSTPVIRIPRIVPAQHPIPAGKRVAVVPHRENNEAEERLAALVSKIILRSGHFSLVERGRVDEVLKEQKFQLSGLVDTADQATKVGRLLGADGMVSIQVHQVRLEEIRSEMEGRPYTAGFEGSLTASLKFVDLTTGSVLAQEQVPETVRDSGMFGPRGTKGQCEDTLFQNVGQKLAHAISPITIEMTVPLKKAAVGDGGLTARGIKLAQKNLLDEAISAWTLSLTKFPKNSGAAYNLGVAFEGRGDIEKSLLYYRQAHDLSPDDDLILDALARLKPAARTP